MYLHQRINIGFKSVFDADHHPKVHFAGNDYKFSLICKERTNFSRIFSEIFDYNTIKIRQISWKIRQKCYLEHPPHIPLKNDIFHLNNFKLFFFKKRFSDFVYDLSGPITFSEETANNCSGGVHVNELLPQPVLVRLRRKFYSF